jgi:hypothetical protein
MVYILVSSVLAYQTVFAHCHRPSQATHESYVSECDFSIIVRSRRDRGFGSCKD